MVLSVLQGRDEEAIIRVSLGVGLTEIVGVRYYTGHVSDREMVRSFLK